jgi:hypothetical protein
MSADEYPGPVIFLIPALFVGLALLRSAKSRNLRIERLWISPAIILVATGLALSQQGWPSDRMFFAYTVSAIGGGLLGWWRGRSTRISVHPETHALTSQTSPFGMVILVAIFTVRFGLRGFMADRASYLHVSAAAITDVFLLLAVGLVCAQRLEIALRASRLLTEARAARRDLSA